jgi:NAD(P)-dependent dehydrogenase (short-subunit alcohol dehydrogenase family)
MAKRNIFTLTGKTALVTGGNSGIGKAYCEALAEFGADVAFTGRDEKKLAETRQALEKWGHKVIALKADMTAETEVESMVSEAAHALGKIDIFFANAGTTHPPIRIHEISSADWDMVINTNLRGVFLGLKYVLPEMIKNKRGSIIITSSIAGLRAEVPEVAPASYSASKAALINLTQVAAMEYVKDNIRVNCIAPGMHKTELARPRNVPLDPEMLKEKEKRVKAYCAAEVPMGRSADASELKGLAILLASDASSYITGQVFVQDGGQSARL